jgi:hypothetical protein
LDVFNGGKNLPTFVPTLPLKQGFNPSKPKKSGKMGSKKRQNPTYSPTIKRIE